MSNPGHPSDSLQRLYDGAAVDAYVQGLHGEIDGLRGEIRDLRARLGVETVNTEKLEAAERTLGQALLRAQRIAETTIAEADALAESKVVAAQAEAASLLAVARGDAGQVLATAHAEASEFIARTRADMERALAASRLEVSSQLKASYARIVEALEAELAELTGTPVRARVLDLRAGQRRPYGPFAGLGGSDCSAGVQPSAEPTARTITSGHSSVSVDLLLSRSLNGHGPAEGWTAAGPNGLAKNGHGLPGPDGTTEGREPRQIAEHPSMDLDGAESAASVAPMAFPSSTASIESSSRLRIGLTRLTRQLATLERDGDAEQLRRRVEDDGDSYFADLRDALRDADSPIEMAGTSDCVDSPTAGVARHRTDPTPRRIMRHHVLVDHPAVDHGVPPWPTSTAGLQAPPLPWQQSGPTDEAASQLAAASRPHRPSASTAWDATTPLPGPHRPTLPWGQPSPTAAVSPAVGWAPPVGQPIVPAVDSEFEPGDPGVRNAADGRRRSLRGLLARRA